jgi:hypothetical protein
MSGRSDAGPVMVMFIDESGDHNLTVIDPQYPIFVLGGIIADRAYAEREITAAVRQFKNDVFGRDDICLHTSDIVRNRNGFERMKEPEFRARFYRELNALMEGLQFSVVACAIRKDEHLSRYGRPSTRPGVVEPQDSGDTVSSGDGHRAQDCRSGDPRETESRCRA